MNPYVFIVGCPRSGTSLLRRMADAHSQLAVMPEQHWLPRLWHDRAGITPDGLVTSDLLDWLLSDRRYELLDLRFKPIADLVENGPPIGYAEFVSRVFDMYGELKAKPFIGEKTPKYVHQLATLSELWPGSRFVHLIRDGRDVALSLLEWPKAERNVGRFPAWTDDPVTTAALYWEWCVRSGRESADLLGPGRYTELRYETLVADAEAQCRQLCSFLDLAYDGRMLRYHEGRTTTQAGISAKKAWLPVTNGLRRWRRDMAAEDIGRFEAAAGDLLDELGYERLAVPTHRERARAGRARKRFVAHLERWGRHVPIAWDEATA